MFIHTFCLYVDGMERIKHACAVASHQEWLHVSPPLRNNNIE